MAILLFSLFMMAHVGASGWHLLWMNKNSSSHSSSHSHLEHFIFLICCGWFIFNSLRHLVELSRFGVVHKRRIWPSYFRFDHSNLLRFAESRQIPIVVSHPALFDKRLIPQQPIEVLAIVVAEHVNYDQGTIIPHNSPILIVQVRQLDSYGGAQTAIFDGFSINQIIEKIRQLLHVFIGDSPFSRELH